MYLSSFHMVTEVKVRFMHWLHKNCHWRVTVCVCVWGWGGVCVRVCVVIDAPCG